MSKGAIGKLLSSNVIDSLTTSITGVVSLICGYNKLEKLSFATTLSFSSSLTRILLLSIKDVIMFTFLLDDAATWKNLVLRSPSRSQWVFALYLQKASS